MVEEFINQYNALDKTTVDRNKLVALNSKAELLAAVSPEINELYVKTKSILDNSKADKFEINIASKLSKSLKGLSNEEIQGLGIPLVDLPEDVGLNGKVSQSDIYQMITDQMIEMINEASGKNWEKRWKAHPFITPYNFITKKPYRGINHNLLTLFGFRSFTNPYFLTFKQIEKLKGTLKKGSKGHPVIYYTRLFIYESDKEGLKIATYDVKKFIKYLKANKSKIRLLSESKFTIEELVAQSYIPIIKYYKIFNGNDIDGIDFNLEELEKDLVRNDGQKLQAAEAIIENFPAPIPELRHGEDRAFYSVNDDYVKTPKIERFDSKLDYYRTLFHEYIHATGHHSRLDRVFSKEKELYAKEELIAEFGAVFLSAEAGIIWRTEKNHAEYIKGWKSVIKDIKKDNRLILRASSAAQKAADYILQRDKDGNPLYLKKLIKKLSQKEFYFEFKKLISEKTIFSHVSKGYNLEKTSDATLAKAYGYALLSKHILSNVRYYPNYKKSSLLSEAGKTSLIKKIKSELDKRDLKVSVNFSIPKQKGKPKQLELGLKGAGEVVLDLTAENQEQPTTVVDIIETNDITHKDITIKGHNVLPEKKIVVDGDKKSNQNHKEISSPLRTKTIDKPKPLNPYKTSEEILNDINNPEEIFNIIDDDWKKFLGEIEKKPKQSLAITLDSPEGGGKTHTTYQFAQVMAKSGYNVIIWSLEEHRDSSVVKQKINKYFDESTKGKISIESDDTELTKQQNFERILNSVQYFDLILIDSWAKVLELNSKVNFDQDLRKKFDGKLFWIIFQRTSDGKMRGGSKGGFDGDIVLKVEKDVADFRNNYVYNHKNRYNSHTPISELKYSPYYQKLIESDKTFHIPNKNKDNVIIDL
ncbi:ArdC family protein [Tenacibaculum sp. MEBiC06402]|uniref:ArdC family protein n=1 Tax=unclassified Tenacibaculum TaxID=2635139 RepID=UPI003B9B7FD1